MLATYVRLEALRFLREPVSLFFSLIFPIVLIYVFGGSFGGAKTESGTTYYNSLVSIDIAFLISNFTLMGIGNDLANQKDAGITDCMSLWPIKKWERTFVQSAAYLMILFVSTIMITFYVYTAYAGIKFKGSVVLFLGIMVLAYFLFVSITKFIVSFNFSARTLQLIASSIFFMLLFTSGIVIPKQSLPTLLQGLVDFSPLYRTYASLDGIWNGSLSLSEVVSKGLYFVVLIGVFSLLSRRRGVTNT